MTQNLTNWPRSLNHCILDWLGSIKLNKPFLRKRFWVRAFRFHIFWLRSLHSIYICFCLCVKWLFFINVNLINLFDYWTVLNELLKRLNRDTHNKMSWPAYFPLLKKKLLSHWIPKIVFGWFWLTGHHW